METEVHQPLLLRRSRLAFAGDVIPVPPLRKILSPGDVLIGLGGAAAVATAMRKILSPGDVLIGLGGAAAVATAMRRRENMAEADASAPVEKAAVPG